MVVVDSYKIRSAASAVSTLTAVRRAVVILTIVYLYILVTGFSSNDICSNLKGWGRLWCFYCKDTRSVLSTCLIARKFGKRFSAVTAVVGDRNTSFVIKWYRYFPAHVGNSSRLLFSAIRQRPWPMPDNIIILTTRSQRSYCCRAVLQCNI